MHCLFVLLFSYQELCPYNPGSMEAAYQSAALPRTPIDHSSLKKAKDEILRSMSSISKSGGNVEEQVRMLLALPYDLDIRDYTKAIQSCNNIHLSSILMDELHNRGLIPDLLLYNVYLKKCEDFKDKDEAFHIYHQLLEDNITPDKHTMIVLIRCCLQNGCPQEAEMVLLDAFNRHIEVNSYMYNLLIDYFARRNQPSEAFRLRLQMNEHGIKPDEYTISSLMAACCPQLPSRTNLLVLLEDVKTSPLPARSVCASALFSGIAKATHLENHQKLKIIVSFFEALRSRGYILGQHAYTSLMTCCAKLGALEQAKLFLHDMRISGVEPNQYILTAFISTCSKAKDYETALNVFNYMRSSEDTREEKRRPNKYTYEAMIVAAGNAGRLNDALQIYSDMLEEGIMSDTSTYSRLIIVCGLCNDLRRGLRFVDEMTKKHLPRTSFFYHALIDLYSRCQQYNAALSVLEEVKNHPTVELSHHHYEPIIRLLVENQQWEEIDRLLEQWNEVSYTTLQYLIVNSHKQHLYSRVLLYETKMIQNGQKPYAALIPLITQARQEVNRMNGTPQPSLFSDWNDSFASSLSPVTATTLSPMPPSLSLSVSPATPSLSVSPATPSLSVSPVTPSLSVSPVTPSLSVSPTPPVTPNDGFSSAEMMQETEPKNTMQFLEKKVASIPEFVPKNLRQPSLVPTSYQTSQSSLWGQSPFSLSMRSSLLNDFSMGSEGLTLDDLDFDLATDFDYFNDYDSMY